MINKLKITDGDLVMIHVPLEYPDAEGLESILKAIQFWIKKHGMNNVTILAVPSNEFKVTALSVNDAFEDEVLKGEDNE